MKKRTSFNQMVQRRDPLSIKKLMLMLETVSGPFLKIKETLTKRRNLYWTIIPNNLLQVKLILYSPKLTYELKFLKDSKISISEKVI